jgi:hypothetical protein
MCIDSYLAGGFRALLFVCLHSLAQLSGWRDGDPGNMKDVCFVA